MFRSSDIRHPSNVAAFAQVGALARRWNLTPPSLLISDSTTSAFPSLFVSHLSRQQHRRKRADALYTDEATKPADAQSRHAAQIDPAMHHTHATETSLV
jgi:hypothetical protein